MKITQLKDEFMKRGIPFVDRHTHSISKYTKSFDLTKSPPIEGPWLNVVKEACRIKLEEIAITDHSYEIFLEPQMEPRTEIQNRFLNRAFDAYLDYLNKVREKFPEIKLIKGIELKIRNDSDLDLTNTEKLRLLDIVLVETLTKKPDFEKIRAKLGNDTIIIFAHPDPGYSCEDDSSEHAIREWVDNMVNNNICFDINRQWIEKFLSDEPIYPNFFRIAKERGLLFSIGSDYHCEPGNYAKFYNRIFELIDKYEIAGDKFLKL